MVKKNPFNDNKTWLERERIRMEPKPKSYNTTMRYNLPIVQPKPAGEWKTNNPN